MPAWKLKEQGWHQKDIAQALGVSKGAVSQWIKRGREGGIAALKAHPATGVKPRLSAEQKAHIPALLAKGAEAYGFGGDVWTARRVSQVIERTDCACALIAITWDDCCEKPVGADSNRWSERGSVMKRPSSSGRSNPGPPSKKSRRGAGTHRLGR